MGYLYTSYIFIYFFHYNYVIFYIDAVHILFVVYLSNSIFWVLWLLVFFKFQFHTIAKYRKSINSLLFTLKNAILLFFT
jgi:hypothetical protein